MENYSFYQDLPDYTKPDYPYRIRLDSMLLTEMGRYVFGILQTGKISSFKQIQYCLFKIQKSNFYFTRLSTDLGVASWQSTSPQLAPRHTVQGCIGGKSMITCVDATDSGFEPSLPRKKLERLTLDHLVGYIACCNCKIFFFLMNHRNRTMITSKLVALTRIPTARERSLKK